MSKWQHCPGENALENPRTRAMCARLQAKWPSLLGDGAGGCSWEWVWQQLGATRFMHNPEYWGLLQFEGGAPGSAALCRNVEWPVRHALTQVDGRGLGRGPAPASWGCGQFRARHRRSLRFSIQRSPIERESGAGLLRAVTLTLPSRAAGVPRGEGDDANGRALHRGPGGAA